MSKPNQLTTIESGALVTATGGAPRSSSSGNLMLQQQLASVTDALSTLKNQNNSGNSLSKWLPMMVAAKVMRGH